MEKKYNFRNLNEHDNLDKLKDLFDSVFKDEGVGDLAVVATENLPGLENEQWYVAEDVKNNRLVSGLAQVDWDLRIGNIKLKAWEQAIVGTLPENRGEGLVAKLNQMLDNDAIEKNVDLIIIQGIANYYNKYGYFYSSGLENHINIQLDKIKDLETDIATFSTTEEDIDILLEQEHIRENIYFLRSVRTKANWKYMLNESKKTEYKSDTLMFEISNIKYYIKIQFEGFGEGLIVTEFSEDLAIEHYPLFLSLLKSIAKKREKPYIRFNLSINSEITKKLIDHGAVIEGHYGWQIKIVDKICFLNKISSILNSRLSSLDIGKKDFIFSLKVNNRPINFLIENLKIKEINSNEIKSDFGAEIPTDLFNPIVLGFHHWKRLQETRPDIFPYGKETEKILDTLFPKKDSWIYNKW